MQFTDRSIPAITLRELWLPRILTYRVLQLFVRAGIKLAMLAAMEPNRLHLVIALYSAITGLILVSMPTAVILAGSSASGVSGSIIKVSISIDKHATSIELVKNGQEAMHEKNNKRAIGNKEIDVDELNSGPTELPMTALPSSDDVADVPSYKSLPVAHEALKRLSLSAKATVHKSSKKAVLNYPSMYLGSTVLYIVTWFLILRQPADNAQEFYISAVSAILGNSILKLIFSHLTHLASKRHKSAKP
ncbi:hypothetical protein HDV05_001026 [Chytridiales sp. JEL 0842]|nr:hypothetical protein HDV05_001026 [Chytridiales sp. JEL 0842]